MANTTMAAQTLRNIFASTFKVDARKIKLSSEPMNNGYQKSNGCGADKEGGEIFNTFLYP